MILGVIYWAVWRVILPKTFDYQLIPNKVVLDDGTVVNVVRDNILSLAFTGSDGF